MTETTTPENAAPEAAKKRDRGAEARAFLARLAERYPECFTRERDKVRPLAIGIQQKLRAELAADEAFKDAPGWLVRQALAIYTRSGAYYAAVVRKEPRINLDGSTAGEVTEQEQAHAQEQLDQIRARMAARRPKRPRRPQRPQRESEEDRTRRKLEQLAEKFSKG